MTKRTIDPVPAPASGAPPGPPRFLASGDCALVVEFGSEVSRETSTAVLALATAIETAAIDGIVELVPTFRSLMVHYDPLTVAPDALATRIGSLFARSEHAEPAGRHWTLPACYDPAVAPDLAEVAAATGLTPSAVAEAHAGVIHHVYMIGFLPGFPYMGDLPAALELPRRADPRLKVPAGSIAIAMRQTVVYTLECPGGWHLIGRTPAPLWQRDRNPPVLLAPGDKVQFSPVSLKDYEALLERAERGETVYTETSGAAT